MPSLTKGHLFDIKGKNCLAQGVVLLKGRLRHSKDGNKSLIFLQRYIARDVCGGLKPLLLENELKIPTRIYTGACTTTCIHMANDNLQINFLNYIHDNMLKFSKILKSKF